ncbi:alanine racemase [Enterococcus sp. 10A9_DIV0425]|uniref:Alanine racemase n=1 Tax=Candidatus Enterococcus wittei TaxID=1987383 RepID=A0A242K0K3_9ENTE|nr:alanine racemase [Enterococcus sp. 10A9_DIV0425]OTP10992.1 alanine racemase [Enterococcus sp. 10A9_DIV0425]THE16243.1 alanine racemase [Enterococcus hirae]
MVVAWHRPTKAIIHKKAITENVANEVSRLSDKELFAVVKANGYGHGAVETAKAAEAGGASGFCVATLDEGIELREAGFVQPILVLNMVPVDALTLAVIHDLSITAGNEEWLEHVTGYLEERHLEHPLKLHLKVDTGMGRIGFRSSVEVNAAVNYLQNSSVLEWEGIFTHFSTADQADTSYWEKQNKRFLEVIENLPELPRYIHSSNSATALWHEQAPGNMIRYGVAMYGLNPSGHELAEVYPLRPALELVSELIQVKKLPAGEGISYGETYVTPKEEWIGTVPIGYADGWLRKMQGFSLLIEGVYCETVGRVCMDQLMVRLPYELPVGTKVTLIGQSGEEEITMQDVADQMETIHYEVACILGPRIPREYQE